jgi:hypothetical protein
VVSNDPCKTSIFQGDVTKVVSSSALDQHHPLGTEISYQRVFAWYGCAELKESAVVDDAVDDGGCHGVISKDRAPAGELESVVMIRLRCI